MSARKHRIPVVLDTNVFVRNFKSRSKSSPNRRVVRLWLLEKRFQLVVSHEIVAEYLEIFAHVLALEQDVVEEWQQRMNDNRRVTMVNPARHESASRDPDDNAFLDAALAGKAHYLITNDNDLLDLPESVQRKYRFLIVTPPECLKLLNEDG